MKNMMDYDGKNNGTRMNTPDQLHHPKPYRVRAGLAVYRIGDGEPVLLMPGPHRFQQPGNGTAAPLIEGLTGIDCQVISFDPPASGQSTRPSRLSMEEMHHCASEALEVCGIQGPVNGFGHSMGGLTMLAYAIEQPAQVKKLVLVGTGTGGTAYMNAPDALWNRTHPAFWRMALLGIFQTVWPRRAPEKMMLNFIKRHSFCDSSYAQPEKVHWKDWLRPKAGHPEWHNIARKLDYAPHLGEIQAQTLLLCGRHDPQYPASCSAQLAAGVPQASLVLFEKSGHYPFIEEREAFWQAVQAFLC